MEFQSKSFNFNVEVGIVIKTSPFTEHSVVSRVELEEKNAVPNGEREAIIESCDIKSIFRNW